MITIKSISKEYIETKLLDDNVDPTTYTVEFAYKVLGSDGSFSDPSSGDWTSGSWVADTVDTDCYFARSLVGPTTSNVLTAGTYAVFIRITTSSEKPIRFVDYLIVE